MVYNDTFENILCFCNLNLVSFFYINICRLLVYNVACDLWLFLKKQRRKTRQDVEVLKKTHKQIASVHAHSDYFLDFFSTILSVLQIYLINKCIFRAHNTQMHATVNSFTECAVMAPEQKSNLVIMNVYYS